MVTLSCGLRVFSLLETDVSSLTDNRQFLGYVAVTIQKDLGPSEASSQEGAVQEAYSKLLSDLSLGPAATAGIAGHTQTHTYINTFEKSHLIYHTYITIVYHCPAAAGEKQSVVEFFTQKGSPLPLEDIVETRDGTFRCTLTIKGPLTFSSPGRCYCQCVSHPFSVSQFKFS